MSRLDLKVPILILKHSEALKKAVAKEPTQKRKKRCARALPNQKQVTE